MYITYSCVYVCAHVCVCMYLSLSICLCLCVHMPWHSCGGQRTAGPLLLPWEFWDWTQVVRYLYPQPSHQPCLAILKWYTFLIYVFINWSLPHTLIQRPGTMKAKGHPDDMTVALRREGVERAEASWDKPAEKMRSCSKFCLLSQGGCDVCTHSLTLHPRWGSCLSSLSRAYFYVPHQC